MRVIEEAGKRAESVGLGDGCVDSAPTVHTDVHRPGQVPVRLGLGAGSSSCATGCCQA